MSNIWIDLAGEKAETRYFNIKQQYDDIIQCSNEVEYIKIKKQYDNIIWRCREVVKLTIDLSYSHIKQETIDKVITQLFYVPIMEYDGSKVLRHKFLDLKNVIVKVEGSILKNVDFIANFFHYYNIKEVEVSCNDIAVAYSFLKQSKTVMNVERIQCEGYFSKHFSVYSIESNQLFTEQTEIWEGFYDWIENIKVNFKSETVEQLLDRLARCSRLVKLEIELVNLNSIEIESKNLISKIAKNCKQLNKLTLKVYEDQLLPPIKMDSFQEQCQLEVQYLQFLQHTPISQLLRKINAFALHQQNISIPLFVELKDNQLKLDLKSRVFTDEDGSGKEAEEKKVGEEIYDFNELMKFLNKTEIQTLDITFSAHQKFSPARWVQMLKIICSKEKLKTVSLSCINISRQISALSLAKLVKSGKINAQVNKSSLNDGVLDFKLHQLSHTVLNVLMKQNCLRERASLFTKLFFTTDIVLGEFQPLSTYFYSAYRSLEELNIYVVREEYDLLHLLASSAPDIFKLRDYFSSFRLSQASRSLNVQLCFEFCYAPPNQMTMKIQNKYDFRGIINQIQLYGRKKLPWKLEQQLGNQLSVLRNYNKNIFNVDDVSDFIGRLKLLQELSYFRDTCIKIHELPMQLSIFFKILAPYIPLNPFMIACDLYYD